MMLFILGVFIGATFGLMYSGLVQGCRLDDDWEADRLEVEERRYTR